MTYQSVHTGAEVDAAVAVLNDVQEIRDEVDAAKGTVVNLADQVQTDAGNASSDAATALQAASDALDSKNAAYASEQAASGHASNADSARAQAVVARNGAEDALGEALNAESRMIELLSDSGPTVDELRAAIRRINYGDGPYPSLDLNFVGATVLDPRVEFGRSSSATYFDAMGVLRTSAPGEPRFDYDPVTGESLGLLVERQATNLLLGSDSPATQAVVVTATAMTLSFIGTGTITLSGAYTGALVGTGDERVTLTFTPSAGSLTLTVSGNVEFAQLETGSVATSYIPTEGSQVTRVADGTSIPLNSFPFNWRAGTLVFDRGDAPFTGNRFTVVIGQNNSNYLGFDYGPTSIAFFQPFAGSITGNNGSQSAPHKYAASWKVLSPTEVSLQIARDGVIVIAQVYEGDTSLISLWDKISVGSRFGAFVASSLMVKGLTIYPRALSNAELQALTS